MTARLLIAEAITMVEGILAVTVVGAIAEVMAAAAEIVEVVTEMSFTAPSASAASSPVKVLAPNPALNLAPFGRWTLRDKAAQRRLALRWADAI